MTLPKKRKRLDEAQPRGQQTVESHISSGEKAACTNPPSEGSYGGSTSEQMQKAFEIIDHIEHTHPLPVHPQPGDIPGPSPGTADSSETLTPDSVRLRISIGAHHANTSQGSQTTQKTSTPVIDVHLKIPSFLWKVPFIRDTVRNLFRKLVRE
jgi:hypothetical protein